MFTCIHAIWSISCQEETRRKKEVRGRKISWAEEGKRIDLKKIEWPRIDLKEGTEKSADEG